MRSLSHIICALVCVLAFSIGASPAGATDKKPSELNLTYDFYLSGLPLAVGKLQAEFNGEQYNAVTALKTVGLVGYFFDVEVVSSADGVVEGGNDLAPALFEMRTRTKEKRQEVRMAYVDAAPMDIEAEPAFRKKPYEVDPATQTGALDPISAILTAFLPTGSANICNRVLPVFDSRKRYDIKFLETSREFERNGEPHVDCKGVYERIAGFKPKMMKTPRYPFKIRFKLNDDGSAQAVRIWGDTAFGVATATLRQ